MKALTFSAVGDASVLQYTDQPKPKPRTQQLLLKNQAIGLNYADI